MIATCCLTLSLSCRAPRYLLLSACRSVIVLAVLVLAVIVALRGVPAETVIGPVLMLVVGTVAAAGRLFGVPGSDVCPDACR